MMPTHRTDLGKRFHPTCLAALTLAAAALPALAASHSDAPLSKQDPQANFTDIYAFIGSKYDDASVKVLNVIAHVRPFCEPGDGPHYDRFADDARYSIHITNPSTGATLVRYDFHFSAVSGGLKNPNTILSYGLGTEPGAIMNIDDARQNYTQTYRVSRCALGGNDDDDDDDDGRVEKSSTASRRDRDDCERIASGLVTCLPNVGSRVTPLFNDADGKAVSGAADLAGLDVYTREAIHDLDTGEAVFAGPREDSFFADVPGIFNLLDPRIIDNNGNPNDGFGQDGGGIDGFKGFNVLTYAIQIPVAQLTASSFNSVFFGNQTGVGVYGTISRPRIRIIDSDGRRTNNGGWVQVNRMGNPLFNEALVALKDKDRFNRTTPTIDMSVFKTYAQNPELAGLINFVFGTSFATSGRTDLVNIFIPEVLRVVTTTDPVRLPGEAGFNRLGFIGGDTTNGVSGGWPNGRRLGDDVVDIALTAIASGPSYSTITVVGDNVPSNDQLYHQVFPYSATPHSGSNNQKDPS